jgi:MFS family permease
MVTLFAALFTLARFSEAFLILRAEESGLALAWAPAVLMVMSVVYALSAYPAGRLSDRIGRTGLLAAGLAVLIAADLVLAFAAGMAAVWAGVALWGLHMGLTQGVLATLVADSAPPDLRGTAFGVMNFATGLAALPASAVAGLLWDWNGPQTTFLAGAGISFAALVALAMARGRLKTA